MGPVNWLLNLLTLAMSLVAVALFALVLFVGAANTLPWLLPVGLVALFVSLAASVVTLWRRRG